MEFEDDIFISYAHVDDRSMIEGGKGWVSSLHRALEIRVAQLLGKNPKIWRDPKLAGNDYFSDVLVDRLPQVALLLAVLSPRYTRSEWCSREVKEFYRAAEQSGGVRIGEKARLFKVVKTPIPLEEQPEELRDTLGYEFFTVDPESGRPRELLQAFGPEAEKLYWARLDDLAYDIAQLLEFLKSQESYGLASTPGPAPDRLSIFVAEPSFDLKAERDAIRRDLRRRGHRVLPDRPLPVVASELEADVRRYLDECRLSIHPIGRRYGFVPDGARESVVAIQHQLAMERSAASRFPRLVWLPPDLAIEEERQARFVELLQTDLKSQQGVDLLEIPLEDLKTVVERQIEQLLRQEAAGIEELPEPEVISIYLICDQLDQEKTAPLEDHLFEEGYEVITSVFEGDEAQVRRDHEESLCVCDAALVFYGEGTELWLRSKLRELMKSAGFGRDKPFLGKAIYVAPPETARKERLRTREATVLRGGENFTPSALEPFLREIRRAESEADR